MGIIMYINRLQAINIAIDAISQLPKSEFNNQAILRLKNMKRDKTIQWTKEMVFEQLDKWKIDHGRNPTVTNLTEQDMPKGITIQNLFDMKASAFLNIYYPTETRKAITSRYKMKTKEEWVTDFVTQYNKIKPKSSNEYNTLRDNGSPTWNTTARYCNCTTWNQLLNFTKVNTSHLKKNNDYENRSYTVYSDIPLYKKLEELLGISN